MKRVILDVDTGIDDAQAILLALKSPELKIEAITTVSGNVHVDKTSVNTLKVLEFAGIKNIPVARGMSKPLIRKLETAEFAHGLDGLANINLPPPELKLHKKHAVDLIIEKVTSLPGDITLISLGPLTNIAMAIMKEPKIVKKIKEHIMMGGAFSLTPYGYGNRSSTAEFNIWEDPEAAKIVFHSGLPITAVGLDITQDPSACLKREQLKKNFLANTKITNFVISLSRFRMNFSKGHAYLHDPIAVSVAIDRSLVKTRKKFVDVEVKGEITKGQTIVDKRPKWLLKIIHAEKKPNINVCFWIDGKRFLDFFINRLMNKQIENNYRLG